MSRNHYRNDLILVCFIGILSVLIPLRGEALAFDGRIMPTTPVPSKHMIFTDLQAFPDDLKLTMLSLQGIINQKQPRLFVNMGGYDQQWAEWLKERGDVKELDFYGPMETFGLIKDFRKELKGQVVVDPNLPATINIATMVAGLNGFLITYPDYAQEYKKRYNLPIKADLTGRWKNSAEAYDWAWKNLWPKMSHRALSMIHPDIRGLRDYLIQQKIFVWWQSGTKDGPLFGNSPDAEKAVTLKILESAPLNIPILGYPWAGDGVGLGENDGVKLFSQYGKYLIPLDHAYNLSVHSGTKAKSVVLRPALQNQTNQSADSKLKLDPTKIYASYIVSDGDNLQAWLNFFRKYWDSPLRGQIPIGWTIGPLSSELMPDVLDYLRSTMSSADTFLCAVSGIGYVYLDNYGESFGTEAREKVLAEFLDLTREYMKRLGLELLWPMSTSGSVPEDALKLYANHIPELKAMFPDYGQRVSGYTKANSLLAIGDRSIPVFKALGPGGLNMVKDLKRLLGRAEKPAFAHAFVFNWDHDTEGLAQIRDELGPDYVFVRPDQLADLYKEWTNK